MHQSCGFLPGSRLKMDRLRDFIITLLSKGLSLTDVHIITEDFGLCHKSIILSNNNKKQGQGNQCRTPGVIFEE